MFKKLLLLSATSMFVTGAALAADLPSRRSAPPVAYTAVPVFTWTGFYVGVSGGGFFGENDVTTVGIAGPNIAAVAANARPQSVSIDNEGFLVGGTVGYNMQFGSFVLGIEGDLSYTDNEQSTTQFNPVVFGANAPGTLRNTFRQEMDYLGTVRGRLGVAFGNVLVYGTGGFAFADVTNTADFSSPGLGPTQFFGSRDETLTGYTVGGGVEFALPTNILPFLGSGVTFKAEYLYYDLGETSVAVVPAAGGTPPGAGGYVSRFENEGQIVRGGINVKFGTY